MAKSAEEEASRTDAKDALAQAYKLLDLAYKENGQIDKAVYSADALALYEELDDLTNQALILNNLGILAQERSRWGRRASSLYPARARDHGSGSATAPGPASRST